MDEGVRFRAPARSLETIERDLQTVSDVELRALRTAVRRALVDYARERMARQAASMGVAPHEVAAWRTCLNPDALTLGFARRFATYKRPSLLLHDPARLLRILSDLERPARLGPGRRSRARP